MYYLLRRRYPVIMVTVMIHSLAVVMVALMSIALVVCDSYML
jgi:hypothetical protein